MTQVFILNLYLKRSQIPAWMTEYKNEYKKVKGKVIPITGLCGLEGG